MADQSWYYMSDDGKRTGPISGAVFTALCKKGVITGDTLVWKEGMGGWSKLSSTSDPAPKQSSSRLKLKNSEQMKTSDNVLHRSDGVNLGCSEKSSARSVLSGLWKLVCVASSVLLVAAMIGLLVYFTVIANDIEKRMPREETPAPRAGAMPIAERMARADRLLIEHEHQAIPIARQVAQSSYGQGGERRYLDALNDLSEGHSRQFSALRLPCPSSKRAKELPGYIDWAKGYEARSRQMDQRINAALAGR